MRNTGIVTLAIVVLLAWTSLGVASPKTIKLALVTKPGSAQYIAARTFKELVGNIPDALAGGLLGMTENPVYLLLLINLVLLVTGVFVETTASLILLVPMITAMVPSLGIDLIQLGVIVVANLAIGMLTPPMGICLIVSASISGQSIGAVSRRVVPFLLVLIVDLALISFYPPLTMWLAQLLGP